MRSRHAECNRPFALAAQFGPPLAVLWPVLAPNDRLLYLGAVLALVIGLASLASLAIRLGRNRRDRGRLLRPTLAVLMAALVLVYANGERNLVKSRVNGLAQSLQGQCRHFNRCPASILGWQRGEGQYASSIQEGSRLRHRYNYAVAGNRFELHLELWGGLDEIASGGADRELKLLGPLPWR